MCYVWYEVSDERWRNDSGHGTDPVDHGHRGTGEVRAQVHHVYFHAGVEKSHCGHADGEQSDHLDLVATRVRCGQRAQHRPDTS